jgi:hypothetical protein
MGRLPPGDAVDLTDVDLVTDRLMRSLGAGETQAPAVLRFLLRRFAATARDDLRDVLGPAIGAALEHEDVDPDRLIALAEAVDLSNDPPLVELIRREAVRCRGAWPSRGLVAPAAAVVEFCLIAARALAEPAWTSDALDELERIVGLAYEPGDGMAQQLSSRVRLPGDLATQVAVSLALLQAFDVTGRLPYPMLAEELMAQVERRPDGGAPDRKEATEATDTAGRLATIASLDAARVLARLARLQRDPDYRGVAVTRGDGDRLAEQRLRGVDSTAVDDPALLAAYGLALEAWVQLT